MPIAGMTGSDVPAVRGFQSVADPYSDASVVVIPSLMPDVAIVHVQEADQAGNARIYGTLFEDLLMVRAGRHVILTTERLVDGEEFERQPESVAISGFMVDAVVEAPGGAWPGSCAGCYDYDESYLAAYVAASRDDDALRRFVADRILAAEPALTTP
jgi:acyl CoA:acetate/3-ketoacid CoA transferase